MFKHKKVSISFEERLLYESWQSSDKIPANIRNRVKTILLISKGKPVSEIAAICALSRQNVYKWLSRYKPQNHKWFMDRSRRPNHNSAKTPIEIERTIIFVHSNLRRDGFQSGAKSIRKELEEMYLTQIPSISTINRLLKKYGSSNKLASMTKSKRGLKICNDSKRRGHRVLSIEKQQTANPIFLTPEDKNKLESWKRSTMTKAGIAKRSEIILLLASGKSAPEAAKILGVSKAMVYKWTKRFLNNRIEGLRRKRTNTRKKYEDESIRSEVFAILHSPPQDYGINRTSWKLDDLKECLSQREIIISKGYMRKIIKSAGYSWRKAKIVLTSPDPEYQKKLKEIQSILSQLESDERFFSIDEFGPFAIKMHGGKRLVAPDEYPYVPQYQKTKGYLIVTAALELSTNQITHFYSMKKNTAEMIKLLDILLREYQTCKTLYLSWDAARWHASKQLFEYVNQINDYCKLRKNCTPIVKLAPLPKSAQFLNVIESVFSGMAKAIIHNSNYESKEAAKRAIDRYFRERNDFFKKNPKRVGKIIWGKELVPSTFSEAQNFKNPKL
jgi:transposase